MIPVREAALRLDKIAEYWARELKQVRTKSEIHAELVAAVWRGELRALFGPEEVDCAHWLKLINRCREHPGFVLVEAGELIPPSMEEREGTTTIYLTRYVMLPSDPATWTENVITSACRQLAQLPLNVFHSLVRPALRTLGVNKAALADYCDRHGWGRPVFWFGHKPERRRGTPGRPSLMPAVEQLMRGRAQAGQLERTLTAEAKVLSELVKARHPGEQTPGFRAIINSLAGVYRSLCR